MRCFSCDTLLNDFESTRKSAVTLQYLDLCSSCLKGLNISTLDREDLSDTTLEEPQLIELIIY